MDEFYSNYRTFITVLIRLVSRRSTSCPDHIIMSLGIGVSSFSPRRERTSGQYTQLLISNPLKLLLWTSDFRKIFHIYT